MDELNEPGTDPVIQRTVEHLRTPVDLGRAIDERVLQALRSSRLSSTPRRGVGSAAVIGGLALAAGLAAVMLVPGPSTRPSAATSVRFSISPGLASRVAVVGDFNDWNPAGTPLHRDDTRGGEWSVTLPLPPGRYRFGFLLDGSVWLPDPNLPLAPDPDFGTPTSILTVEPSGL